MDVSRTRLAQIAAVVAAVAVLAVFAAHRALGSLEPGDPYAQPGRLVSLPDHRKLNFRCEGRGSPTVLLEAGYGAGSNAWGKVAPRIATVTRVCAYDRAGYGFSDPGPMPRDGAAVARDLDLGLKAAGIEGRYVVVAHSAGGLYARLFAARRRGEISGLVFVDSSVEHQTQRMQQVFGPNAGSIDSLQRRALKCLNATSEPKRPADDPELAACVPAHGADHERQVALRPDTYRTQLSELENLFTSTSDEVDRIGPLLQTVPAIVLTAADGDGPAGVARNPGAALWQGFHKDLAAGFHPGEQRLVKSSHMMMFDRPEVVADAALELVKAARAPPP
jgi:pimeloyl-ACP methyl ester carboxylesterase